MGASSPLRIGVLGAAAIVPSALTGPARSVPDVTVTAIAARNPDHAAVSLAAAAPSSP